MNVKTALMQLLPEADARGCLRRGVEYCERAKALGADIALFPEMWSCGYSIPQDINELRALAVPRDGEYMRGFSRAARQLGMAIAVTALMQAEPLPLNTVTLFDRFGEELFTYAKVHTCDFGDERVLGRGNGFYTAPLDTGRGVVQVGAMICYDREFPESARLLMLRGAELILVPNACPMEINRISQLRARAYENMTGIATTNYPYGKPDCNGHSTAFDGMAYLDGRGRDTLVVEAGEGEGIYLADFPLDRMRRYRESEVHGNAYRRPELYSELTARETAPPFIRADRRE